MKNEILLSIVIPVYNVERFLPECLDSIVEQNFPTDEYEIICVNDGSPDNSQQILEDYAHRYENIKIIVQKNSGVAVARETGCNNAQGKYIWFIDSDDFAAPDSLNNIKSAIIENNYPDRVKFRYYSIEWNNVDTREDILKKSEAMKDTIDNYCIWHHIYNRNILIKNNITKIVSEKKMKFAEDVLLNFLFMSSENECVQDNTAIYFYRLSQYSITKRKSYVLDCKKSDDYITLVSEMKSEVFSNQQKSVKQDCANQYMTFSWVLMGSLALLPINYRWKYFHKAIKEKVFPFKIIDEYSISKENTLKWALGSNKVEKYLNCHCQTYLGYFALCIFYIPLRAKTALKRLLKR